MDTGDINKINDDEYEDYISAIREELHQDNPDLFVYCDKLIKRGSGTSINNIKIYK